MKAKSKKFNELGEKYNKINKLLLETKKNLKQAQGIAHLGNWEVILSAKIFLASEEVCQLCGIQNANHILSLNEILKLIYIRDKHKIWVGLLKGMKRKEKIFNLNFRIIRADNKNVRNMHSIAEVEYNYEGKAEKIVGVIQDVTERINYELELKIKNQELISLYEELRELEYELRRQFNIIQADKKLIALSEERYKTLVNSSHDLIYSCNCKGNLITVNEMFIKAVEQPQESVLGRTLMEIAEDMDIEITTKYIEKWNNAFNKVIGEGKANCFIFSYKKKAGGRIYYYDVTLSPLYDIYRNIVGVIGANHDITSIKENEEKAKHLAYYDLVTDFPNRTFFLNYLTKGIEVSKKKANHVIVVILNLDNFKAVNNMLGHAKGDDLLIETAQRLQRCINKKGMVARLSGDEFSLLLEDAEDEDEIVYFLRRIRAVFEDPFNIPNGTISLTASIGISVYPDDGDTNEELINNATTAMYKAKNSGKNRCHFFDYQIKHDFLRKIHIEQSLRKAIKNNEFVLFYQPQYNIKRELRGFEALIRWINPQMGLIHPAEFIPIAEESGLINQIGEWALSTAAQMSKKLEDKYHQDLIMAVNISPIQLRQKNFVEVVTKIIELSKIKSSTLELEVTESSLIDYFDKAVCKLEKLRGLGVRVALDDFGTGYSSLSYLKNLPIDLLKIDKSFIQEIGFVDIRRNLTEPIISLVNRLDIETMAEGVETVEQVNYLISAKCNYIQGYIWGKPGPEESLSQIIENHCLK